MSKKRFILAVLLTLAALSLLLASCKESPSVTTSAGTTDALPLQTSAELTTADKITTQPITSAPVSTAVSTAPITREYTVSFDTGGAGKISDVIIKEGEILTFPEITLEGAVFDGWYLDRALTKKADTDNFKADKDTKLFAKWIKDREIRLYFNEKEYTSLYFREGTVVDVSKWDSPKPIILNGMECPFSHWVDEQLDDIIKENFTMPSRSLAFYAVYEDAPSKNNFYVYKDANGNLVYESIVANAMTSVEGFSGKYGKWEVTVTETNPDNTRLGIFINANIPDSVKYGGKTSGYGFYFHHNVSANTRFVLVDYYNGYRGVNAKDYLSASYNAQSGNAGVGIRKYYEDNLKLKSGEIDALVFKEAIEVTPDAINLYVNDELIGSFTDKSIIKIFTEGGTYGGKEVAAATGVGFTTNSAGTKFSDFKYTPYSK